jgi:hypothetical protein
MQLAQSRMAVQQRVRKTRRLGDQNFILPKNRVAWWTIGVWNYFPQFICLLLDPVLIVFISTVFHAPIGHVEDHVEDWTAFHNRIKPTSKPSKSKNVSGPLSSPSKKSSNNKKNTSKNRITIPPTLETVAPTANQPKVSVGINKHSILLNYEESCISKGITNQVSTIIKGENLPTYPSHHHLIANCKMKPSLDLYYRAKDPHFDNVVIFVVRWPGVLYLTANELDSLRSLNKHYRVMIDNVQ